MSGRSAAMNINLQTIVRYRLCSAGHQGSVFLDIAGCFDSLKNTLCPDPHALHGNSPWQTKRRMGIAGVFSTLRPPTCCENQRSDPEGSFFACGQSCPKRNQQVESDVIVPSTMLTKDTIDEEARSVQRRESVIRQNTTKLASIATRFLSDSDNEFCDGWELVVALAGVNRDRIYSHPDTEFSDGRALAAAMTFHSRNIGSSSRGCSTEFSRPLSRPVVRVGSCRPVLRLSFLEPQRDRIRSVSLDMHVLKRSSCVDMATSSAQLSPRIPAVRLRALVQRHRHGGPASAERRNSRTTKKRTRRTRRRRRRSEKRAGTDRTEESSSVDRTPGLNWGLR